MTANARRAQIVAAAVDTIAELGYARASFAKIAERAELSSTRLISYHFKGKFDLIQAVVDEALALADDYMGPRIRAASTKTEALDAYIRSNMEYMREYPNHVRAMVDIFNNAQDEGADVSSGNLGTAVDLLTEQFAIGQRDGEFRDFDPLVMAASLRGSIDAAAAQLAHNPDLDVDAYGAELAELFRLATRKDPS
ncbi:MAG TPA: TetR family transcriptional regulator [Stackebrandtia sp.]|uniref:TetR/AcrR family transcriptional regulator n=1 Tax=Stackebrandtia sp. TaxID=2023065 RepID=UPI002D5653B8|nr:TetR family transcriptional regulator [Stackebrandtia sp.]HZE41652.1 TetR family transcriptional regulator [Stackebrandtia sp.]